MLKGKRIGILSIVAFSFLSLAACSTDYDRYPADFEDPLFSNSAFDSVYGNEKKDYYDSVMTSDEVYQHTVNEILLDIADVAHGYTGENTGSPVYSVIDDSSKSVLDGSVADGTDTGSADFNNRLERSKTQVRSNATSDSYKIDNLFYENKFVQYLMEQFQLPEGFDVSKVDEAPGKLVTPDMTYDDIFVGNYDKYMEDYLYDDITLNYLTSEFIYTKNFSSIGNANARKVQVIGLTDREDDPGAARQLLDAYIRDYITGEGTDEKYKDLLGSDPDFSVLSKLWKGITKGDIDQLIDESAYADDPEGYADAKSEMEARYASVTLTDEQVQWLEDNNIIYDDGTSSEDGKGQVQGTLAGKIVEDQKKLEEGYQDFNKLDTSLESQYTGSYTYDYRTGLRMAYDDIAIADYVTDGVQLSSDGLSNLPSDLKDRIFSSDFTTDKDDIAEMKEKGKINENAGKDITTYMADGNRYLTVPGTAATESDSSILYYDSSSRTYYITRILDVVDNDALGTYGDPNENSVYDTAEKQERIAREVAYAMSTTGSYKSNATIYWLRRTKIDYSDEDFLDYMKSNYQDLFRTESATDGDPIITLPQD